MSEVAWTPDGRGLESETLEQVAEHGLRVHLRLTTPDRRSARGACDRGLGELWSGKGSEVTCSACLEWVHA